MRIDIVRPLLAAVLLLLAAVSCGKPQASAPTALPLPTATKAPPAATVLGTPTVLPPTPTETIEVAQQQEPTAPPVRDSTQTPPSVASPTAPGKAGGLEKFELGVLNLGYSEDSRGDLIYMGELWNPGKQDVAVVLSSAVLLDASSQVLASLDESRLAGVIVAAWVLGPGESTLFKGIFVDPPAGWSDFQLEAYGSPVGGSLAPRPITLKTETLEVAANPVTGGGYRASGVIKNVDSWDCSSCNLWLTLYGPDGSVVGLESQVIPRLLQGETASFQISIAETVDSVTSYHLTVYGRKGTRD